MPISLGLGLGISQTNNAGGEPTPPPAAQSLFSSAQLTGLTSAGDSSGYNLGFKVIPSVNGHFSAVYFGKPNGAVQSLRRCGIYNGAGDLLMKGSIGEIEAEGAAGTRITISLDEPLAVTAATTYTVQVTVNGGGTGGYAAQANGFSSAVTNGDLTAPSDAGSGGNGVFNDTTGVNLAFASTDGSANYWVDVMFTPGAIPAFSYGTNPTAASTGATGTLPAYGGPTTITTNDTVIENVTISSGLTIEADGVVINNCAITYTDAFGINADGRVLTVTNCTITGPGVAGAVNSGIIGSGTFTGNKISGSENGIVVQSGASTVSGNYIYDLRSNAAVPHYDGISCQGGQNGVLIQNNTIVASDTSAIFLKDDFGAITNVTIDGNLCLNDPSLGPPGYPIVIDQVTSITSITVTDNRLECGGFGYYSDEIGATTSGNVNAWTGMTI